MKFGKAVVCGWVAIVVVALAACAGGGSGGGSGGDDPTHGGIALLPTEAMAAKSGKSLEMIGQGYWVFQRKCAECHVAKLPKDPNKTGWHAMAAGMAWNAGLMKSEEMVLLAYIDAVKE